MSRTNRRAKHFGWPISHYSAKTRSYLRFKKVPFDDISPNAPQMLWTIRRAVGRPIMPTVQMPDGAWLQDSSAIIDAFDSLHPTPSIHPEGAAQRIASFMLEYLADEWMQLTSIHSRWHFAENHSLGKREIAKYALPVVPAAIGIRLTKPFVDRMLGYQSVLGIDEHTRPGIDILLQTVLDSLETQLSNTNYVLGDTPSLGDFALFGPLSTHTAHEPASKHLVETRPAVRAWITRLTHGAIAEGDWLADDEVPEALDPIFKLFFEDTIPWLRSVVSAVDAYVDVHPEATRVPRALGTAPFTVCGRRGERKLVTFTQWKGQRLCDAYQLAGRSADHWLSRFGDPTTLIPTIHNRIVRRDFREFLERKHRHET